MFRRYCPPTSYNAAESCPRLHTCAASISCAKTFPDDNAECRSAARASGDSPALRASNASRVEMAYSFSFALDNAVPGILGDCGGSCSCATCHAYVDAHWADKLPAISETETFMLEGVPDPRENSRLCCQIKMQVALDGIVVQLPEVQA